MVENDEVVVDVTPVKDLIMGSLGGCISQQIVEYSCEVMSGNTSLSEMVEKGSEFQIKVGYLMNRVAYDYYHSLTEVEQAMFPFMSKTLTDNLFFYESMINEKDKVIIDHKVKPMRGILAQCLHSSDKGQR